MSSVRLSHRAGRRPDPPRDRFENSLRAHHGHAQSGLVRFESFPQLGPMIPAASEPTILKLRRRPHPGAAGTSVSGLGENAIADGAVRPAAACHVASERLAAVREFFTSHAQAGAPGAARRAGRRAATGSRPVPASRADTTSPAAPGSVGVHLSAGPFEQRPATPGRVRRRASRRSTWSQPTPRQPTGTGRQRRSSPGAATP